MNGLSSILATATCWSAPVLAAAYCRLCLRIWRRSLEAWERSLGAPDAETRTTPEEEP